MGSQCVFPGAVSYIQLWHRRMLSFFMGGGGVTHSERPMPRVAMLVRSSLERWLMLRYD